MPKSLRAISPANLLQAQINSQVVGQEVSPRHHRIIRHGGIRHHRRHFRHHHQRRHYRDRGRYIVPGLIIGGIIANELRRDRYVMPSSHYRWCDRRYRSYRAYDNTFQPYVGNRRQCISPYFR